eukprot:GHVT01045106.1.p1 GENE.GHVT01045106.1~~GHVT01045106.1.p1  ORF type:complete len:696 (+),score=122.90 GHVT01045106.1:1408-3495(+)
MAPELSSSNLMMSHASSGNREVALKGPLLPAGALEDLIGLCSNAVPSTAPSFGGDSLPGRPEGFSQISECGGLAWRAGARKSFAGAVQPKPELCPRLRLLPLQQGPPNQPQHRGVGSGQPVEKDRHAVLGEMQLATFRTGMCAAHRLGRCANPDACDRSHCLTWQRRNPYEMPYRPELCPDIEFRRHNNKMTLTRRCARGRNCDYAHSKEEELYHPLVYKTKLCTSSPMCLRHFCPFAHSQAELRNPQSELLIRTIWGDGSVEARPLAVESQAEAWRPSPLRPTADVRPAPASEASSFAPPGLTQFKWDARSGSVANVWCSPLFDGAAAKQQDVCDYGVGRTALDVDGTGDISSLERRREALKAHHQRHQSSVSLTEPCRPQLARSNTPVLKDLDFLMPYSGFPPKNPTASEGYSDACGSALPSTPAVLEGAAKGIDQASVSPTTCGSPAHPSDEASEPASIAGNCRYDADTPQLITILQLTLQLAELLANDANAPPPSLARDERLAPISPTAELAQKTLAMALPDDEPTSDVFRPETFFSTSEGPSCGSPWSGSFESVPDGISIAAASNHWTPKAGSYVPSSLPSTCHCTSGRCSSSSPSPCWLSPASNPAAHGQSPVSCAADCGRPCADKGVVVSPDRAGRKDYVSKVHAGHNTGIIPSMLPSGSSKQNRGAAIPQPQTDYQRLMSLLESLAL